MWGKWYYESDTWLYDAYLSQKWWSSTQSNLVKQSPKYWNTEKERIDNFQKAVDNYSASKAWWSIEALQESLDVLVELKNKYSEIWGLWKKWLKATWKSDSAIIEWISADKINNVKNLYWQVIWKTFIDNVIDSKSKGATYWPLSDNEWKKITQAASSLNLNTPSDFDHTLQQMIDNIALNIEELWWTPDTKSWKDRISNIRSQLQWNTAWTKITSLRSTSIPLSSIQNPAATTVFNQQWRSPVASYQSSAITWYTTMMQ